MVTRKQVLRECQVFSALSDAELEKVASSVVEKEYEAGAALFQQGDSATEFFVIEEGKVALQMTLPKEQGQMSKRLSVDVVSKNEAVGWSAIVEPHIYTLTAVCLQKTKVLSISSIKLRGLLRDNPKMGFEVIQGLIKVVASRLDETRHVLASERSVMLKTE